MLNDYKGLKLIASSNPHIRNNEDTRSIMLDVIIALCPALIMSVIRFGFRALISVLVSVVSAMFFEWLYRKLMHKTQTLGDLSAAVTGVLRAGGDVFWSTLLDVGPQWCMALPLTALLALVLKVDYWWIAAAIQSESLLKVPLCALRIRTGQWIHDVTVRKERGQ